MYYILYNLKTLKVAHIYTKPLTAKVCDNFYEVYGIAEYKGEIPKNDWLSVDNVREEIETWKEKQVIDNYDDNGNVIAEEVEVEKSKTHIICDLIPHFYPKVELTEEQKAKQKQLKYERLCQQYIRERYSATDENKVVREYLADMYNFDKKTQFDEYNTCVENCKSRARVEVYN